MESSTGGGGGRWRLRHVVPVVLLWMTLHSHVLGCSSTNCNLVLTEVQGTITSPCYPQKYPNSQTCKWIMQAPAGFIIQLSFLDFDLEEAQGCIYDRVVVNTGNTDVKFCGLTANGLTLNSTGNVMELSFTSDFSVQKKGFSVSFRHVAVALRNQKVKITGGSGQVTKVSSSVYIPILSELTLCFEVERTGQRQKEWFFTYYDTHGSVRLSLGTNQPSLSLLIDGIMCPINRIVSISDFTSTMKQLCVVWKSSGDVGVYFNGNYRTITCSSTYGRSVPGGGQFRLGGHHHVEGNMYNLRLWNYSMTAQQLQALTCDTPGNVIDWDNSHWTIPSTLAQTDTTLSCSISPPSNTPLTTSCDSRGLGCPAASSPATSSTDSTNTIHATNANTHAQQTTSSTTTVSSVTTNNPTTNPAAHGTTLLLVITNQPTTSIAVTTTSSGATETPVTSPSLTAQSESSAAGPAAHHRRLRHVFGLMAAGALLPQAPGPPQPPAIIHSHHTSSSARTPNPPHPAYQPRLSPPVLSHPAPPESSHTKPLASFSRPPGRRSSKTSLGFISTPLIWQGRKRPTGGRRQAATRAPAKPTARVTKPSVPPAKVKTTARPTDATQTNRFKYTAGFAHVPAHLHTSAQPTSRSISSHRPFTNNEFPTTTSSLLTSLQEQTEKIWGTKQFSEVGASSSSSSPLLSSSSSALGNRKNKPAAPQWSLLTISGGKNQTAPMGNRTDPLEPLDDDYVSGTESFGYESTDGGTFSSYQFDGAFSLEEPATSPPSFIDPDAKNEQSLNRSDPRGALLPVKHSSTPPERASEHLLIQTDPHDGSENLSGFGVISHLSLTHSQDRLTMATFRSRSQIPTATVSHSLTNYRVSNNTSSNRERPEESLYSQAAPQQMEKLTFQPAPFLLLPSFSSLFFRQPTPSLPTVHLSSSGLQSLSSSVPQKEDRAQIAYFSLSLNPQDSVYETNIAGNRVKLATAKSRLINNLYTRTEIFRQTHSLVPFILHRPSFFSSFPPVLSKTSVSDSSASPLDVPHYPSSTVLTLTSASPSIPLLSASTSLTSFHDIAFSTIAVTLQISTSPPLWSSNSLTSLSSSPPLLIATIPPHPSAASQHPPLLRSSSTQQGERRLSGADGVVESAHVLESDGVSGNFQPSLLSFLSLSSNLQSHFVVTTVDAASFLSLPLFSKGANESQMPVVDGALLPENHLLSAESSFSSMCEPFRSCLPSPQGNQLQSGPLAHSINPTPSGLSVGKSAPSSVILTPDLPPQMQTALSQLELLEPQFDLSVVLSPSLQAASLSVRLFLLHSDQRDWSDIYTLPVESHPLNQSYTGFTSPPTAGIWASEHTLALLQANLERKQSLHSASLSVTSSSSHPFLSSCSSPSSPLHHLDNLFLTVSPEIHPVATVTKTTEQMVEGTAVSSSLHAPNPVVETSPLIAHASSLVSQGGLASSLTFNRDPWRLERTISHLHTINHLNTNTTAGAHTNSRGSQALTGYDNTFNHPISPLSNPSVMALTQTLALHSTLSTQPGSAAPQHALGLDYTYHLERTITEQHSHLIRTHSSAFTQMLTHLGAQAQSNKFVGASEKLDMSPGQDTQNAHEAHADVWGLQWQSSLFVSSALTPCLLLPSTVSSLSLATTVTPSLPSLKLSVMSQSMSVSPLPLSSSPSPLLPSWMPLPAVAGSMAVAETGSLSPTLAIAAFPRPTTTQPPHEDRLQSFQQSTTYPVSQSTESVQQFITVSHSLPLGQVSTPLELENNPHTMGSSMSVDGVVSSLQASNTIATAGILSHLSQVFYPADFVPKIHIVDEHASAVELVSSAVMFNVATGLQPSQSLILEVALNTQSFPVEMQTTSPHPTSEPSYLPSYGPLRQPTGAQIIQIHASDLNVPSSTTANGSPPGSSIDAPDHGFISGLAELRPLVSDNLTENTAGSKYIFKSNATTVALKDSASEMTNTTKDKNTTTLIENGNIEASQGNLTGDKPTPDLSVNAGISAKSNFTLSKPGLNSSPSVSNHSGNQTSGVFVNGAANTNHSDVRDVHLSATPPADLSDNHFTPTKNSSPTAPLKAVSTSAGSSGLKKATVRPTRGSPAAALTAKPTLPCQCKQRFHFTCLCGLSPGNSMSCSNKKP